MEIRSMRYFLEVAREENMSRAAERLRVSQSTLSKQMKQLEEELGKKLFVRHSFSIELTEEGMLLRKRAEDLVSLAEKIMSEFQTMDEPTGGELFLGMAETWQVRHIARVMNTCKRLYPDLHYHITSGDTEQVTEKLEKGLVDFAVLVEPPDPIQYESLRLPESDRWGVMIPASDPLAQKAAITVDDLMGKPLFCSEQSQQRDIPRWCGERAKELRFEGSFRLAYNGSLFTREGLGYLLTLEHLISEGGDNALVFRPLEPCLENDVYLIWKKYQVFTPMAERFLAKMQAYCLAK